MVASTNVQSRLCVSTFQLPAGVSVWKVHVSDGVCLCVHHRETAKLSDMKEEAVIHGLVHLRLQSKTI